MKRFNLRANLFFNPQKNVYVWMFMLLLFCGQQNLFADLPEQIRMLQESLTLLKTKYVDLSVKLKKVKDGLRKEIEEYEAFNAQRWQKYCASRNEQSSQVALNKRREIVKYIIEKINNAADPEVLVEALTKDLVAKAVEIPRNILTDGQLDVVVQKGENYKINFEDFEEIPKALKAKEYLFFDNEDALKTIYKNLEQIALFFTRKENVGKLLTDIDVSVKTVLKNIADKKEEVRKLKEEEQEKREKEILKKIEEEKWDEPDPVRGAEFIQDEWKKFADDQKEEQEEEKPEDAKIAVAPLAEDLIKEEVPMRIEILQALSKEKKEILKKIEEEKWDEPEPVRGAEFIQDEWKKFADDQKEGQEEEKPEDAKRSAVLLSEDSIKEEVPVLMEFSQDALRNLQEEEGKRIQKEEELKRLEEEEAWKRFEEARKRQEQEKIELKKKEEERKKREEEEIQEEEKEIRKKDFKQKQQKLEQIEKEVELKEIKEKIELKKKKRKKIKKVSVKPVVHSLSGEAAVPEEQVKVKKTKKTETKEEVIQEQADELDIEGLRLERAKEEMRGLIKSARDIIEERADLSRDKTEKEAQFEKIRAEGEIWAYDKGQFLKKKKQLLYKLKPKISVKDDFEIGLKKRSQKIEYEIEEARRLKSEEDELMQKGLGIKSKYEDAGKALAEIDKKLGENEVLFNKIRDIAIAMIHKDDSLSTVNVGIYRWDDIDKEWAELSES
ncbi:MAG: hypothetical protein ABH827_01875 [bacterium]